MDRSAIKNVLILDGDKETSGGGGVGVNLLNISATTVAAAAAVSIMDGTSSKMNPLKTTKQRNTSNSHRKNHQQRSTTTRGRNNGSTDEEVCRVEGNAVLVLPTSTVTLTCPAPTLNTLLPGDDEGFSKCEGDNENENTTNNDDGSGGGFIDSENENIAERLCSLSKLSLHGNNNVKPFDEGGNYGGHFSGVGMGVEGGDDITHCCGAVGSGSAAMAAFSPHSVPISKVRNPSYPSFHESDSISEAHLKNHFIPLQSSCAAPGATTTGDGDGASEAAMEDCTGRRFRRRRRRRGHKTNTKRMAVDATVVPLNIIGGGGEEKVAAGYSIRAAERPGPSGASQKKFNKLDKANTATVVDPLDAFGMKRKRNIVGVAGIVGASLLQEPSDTKLGDIDMTIGDVGSLSLNSPEIGIDDQEMKSEDDDDCSSCDSVDEGEEDDRCREADDEQSDWVFDEWSSCNPNKSKEESASSRKKRLLKMLRNYNDMISANVGGGGLLNSTYQIQTREIRAGKRRVFVSKPGFPAKGIWTSANEEVSKFLQDPLQSQIRLQPISAEEGVQLSHLASLYSLRMDYCNNAGEETKMEDISQPDEDDADSSIVKLIPVLTKTPNTTQMDKTNTDPSTYSPFNAEGSSSSNVSSVYGPTFSDVDSRTSDSKRIKK